MIILVQDASPFISPFLHVTFSLRHALIQGNGQHHACKGRMQPVFTSTRSLAVLSAVLSYLMDAGCRLTPPSRVRSSFRHLKFFCLFCFSRMTSVDVNDENLGVCPPGKQHSSVNDIFNLDQPTGRPSILRQTENLPSKTVPKGTKVENKFPLLCVLYTLCCQTMLCLWIWYYLIRPHLMSALQAITYAICFGSLIFFLFFATKMISSDVLVVEFWARRLIFLFSVDFVVFILTVRM